MRILHVVARSHRRGAELVAVELAEELTSLGHENDLLALGVGLDGSRDPALPTLTGSSRVKFDVLVRCAFGLRRSVSRHPVDLILAHGGWSAAVAALAFPWGGPPVVWQRILGLPRTVWKQSQTWRWKAVARHVDGAAVLTSEFEREMRRLGFGGPCWIIPNARQPRRFAEVDRADAGRHLRGVVGVEESTTLLGFVGHLVDQKCPHRALDVLARVLDAGEDAHLVIAGDGPLRPRLEAEIAQRGLGHRVTLLGHRNDVERIFGALDLVLITSAAEGIPGVAIEAQMTGCPVVSFPLGGVAEVVDHEVTGLVLDHSDVDEMAERVLELIRAPEWRQHLGREARARGSWFSAHQTAVRYEACFRDLLAGTDEEPQESGLRLYWYWPFARAEDVGIAKAAMRPGDSLVIQTLDRPGVPVSGPDDPYVVLNDGPEVRTVRERTLRWLASRTLTYVGRVWARHRALWSGDFDVVHMMFVNRFTDGIDLALLRRRHRIVCSVHDVYPHQPRLPSRVEHALLKAQFHSARILLVHNEGLRSLLIEDFDIDPDKVEIVPHQVPNFAEEQRSQRSDPPMVLFFGTLRRNKGVEVLVDAIRNLDLEDIGFHFAGRGFEDMEDLVRGLTRDDPRVSADLTWITPERKTQLFSQASLVALPYTRFESESGVLHDAYGHGRPVLVTDVGSLGTEVREAGTGWVVPPGDPEALNRTILTALSDGSGYAEAERCTRQLAHARRPDAVGARLREVYERLARNR